MKAKSIKGKSPEEIQLVLLQSMLDGFMPKDGSAPAYYRMAELYFSGPEEMQQTLNSPEGQAMAADLVNFTSGEVTLIFGSIA